MLHSTKFASIALVLMVGCLPQVAVAQAKPAADEDVIPKDMFPPKGPLKLVPVFRAPKGDAVFVDEASIKMVGDWAEVWSLRIFAAPTKIGSVALWRRASFRCKSDDYSDMAFVSLDPAGKIIKHVPGDEDEMFNSARWRDDGAIVAVACGRRKATGPHFATIAKAAQAAKSADNAVWKPLVDLPVTEVSLSSPTPSADVPVEPVQLSRVVDGTATKTDSLYIDLASVRHEKSYDGTVTSYAWVVRAYRENRTFYAPDAAAGLMRVEVFCLPKLKRVTAAVALDAQGKVLQRTENPGGYSYYVSDAGTPEDTLTKAVCNDIKASGPSLSTWKAAIDWTRGVQPPAQVAGVAAKPAPAKASTATLATAKPAAAGTVVSPAKAQAKTQTVSPSVAVNWNYGALDADSNFAYQPNVIASSPDEAGMVMMMRYRQPRQPEGAVAPVFGTLRMFNLRCAQSALQLDHTYYFDAEGQYAGELAGTNSWVPAGRIELAEHLVDIYCVAGELPRGEAVLATSNTQVAQKWLRDLLPTKR